MNIQISKLSMQWFTKLTKVYYVTC